MSEAGATPEEVTRMDNIHKAFDNIFNFHENYFNNYTVLDEIEKRDGVNNLLTLFNFFEINCLAEINEIKSHHRSLSKRKDKSLYNESQNFLKSLNSLYFLGCFMTAKAALIEDGQAARNILKKISYNWDRAYAAQLLLSLTDVNVYNFCKDKKYDKMLENECHKVITNFSRSFNDFNLANDIGKLRSKKIQCLLYLLQSTVDNILYLLLVEFDDFERKVAHYTSLMGFHKIICEGSKLRLSSGELMNDPSEGQLLLKFMGINEKVLDNTFLTCFTFNHNSLNQFRLYGRTEKKEGTGISLVLNKNYFSSNINGFLSDEIIGDSEFFSTFEKNNKSLPLFRCIYIDIATGFIQVARRNRVSFYQEYVGEKTKDEINDLWVKYNDKIIEIEKKLYKEIESLQKLVSDIQIYSKNKDIVSLIQRSLRPLFYLFKHIAFQEEQECRVFYVTDIQDEKVELVLEEKSVFYMYNYDLKAALENVYIGPASHEKSTYIRKALAFNPNIKVSVCDSPFISK